MSVPRLQPGPIKRFAGVLACVLVFIALHTSAVRAEDVDTALVVSVDVSNSVDEHRYQLQMEGIAQALEDPSVMEAILNGPQGGIAFSLVSWADRPRLEIPWTIIKSREDAAAIAATVRKLPRHTGEFTCVSHMLRNIADKIVTQVPATANRIVVDVSGDGSDNCNATEPIGLVRDELVESGVTINGLPILEGAEKGTLEDWYKENVKGGLSGFVLPAQGFEDFGRAIRQKFVIEISGVGIPPGSGERETTLTGRQRADADSAPLALRRE